MAKTEVAVKQTNALALASDFEQDAQSGLENMSQDDFALPFLKLLTNTSPEVGEIDGALPSDAGATQDAEEFGRRQLLRAVLEQAFARSLPFRPLFDRPRISLPLHYFLTVRLSPHVARIV